MFKRLNTGGSLLSAQEIRNCSSRMISGGDVFYEAIQKMAQDPSFRNAISRLPESSIEKRGDEELVLRFFAVTTYRQEFKGNIEEWLDALMENILFKRQEFDVIEKAKQFSRVFKIIDQKLGTEAFTRFNEYGEATGRLAPAYFEAVVSAFFHHLDVLEKIPPETVKKRLIAAFSSAKFKAATGPGANTIGKLEQRVSIVTGYLVSDGNN